MKNLFFLNPKITYLNHGSYGACPIPVFNDYQKWQKRLESQPAQFFTDTLWEYLKHTRQSIGSYINCSGNDLILFPNTTTAVNNIFENLNLVEGDEVLMTQHEYGALIRAWGNASKKYGFKIVKKEVSLPLKTKNEFLTQFLSAISNKTKVIFISQITSQTALIFPVSDICKHAKKLGIRTIVDGAHVPGHINLDLMNIGCDYYTGACHKWLCAPKGSSFLYVRKELQNKMIPQTISWGEEGEDPGPTKLLQDFQWQGTRDMSAFLAIPSAIEFVEKHSWKKRQGYCREIILDVSNKLNELLKTEPNFLGEKWVGQMVSHPLPSNAPENLKLDLWNKFRIEVPIFEWGNNKYIRISFHCYNKKEDIDKLFYALKKLLF